MDSERIPRGLEASLAKSRIDLPRGQASEYDKKFLTLVLPLVTQRRENIYLLIFVH